MGSVFAALKPKPGGLDGLRGGGPERDLHGTAVGYEEFLELALASGVERVVDYSGGRLRMADDDPSTMVTHARMHQLVARKPL